MRKLLSGWRGRPASRGTMADLPNRLLQLAKGVSAPRIVGVVPLILERALYEKERPRAAEPLKDSQGHLILGMVCRDPPDGRAALVNLSLPSRNLARFRRNAPRSNR